MKHVSEILKAMTTDPNVNWRVRSAIAAGLTPPTDDEQREPEPGKDAA